MNPVRLYIFHPHRTTTKLPKIPANHLDLPAIVWLQSYLTNDAEGQTVVVVSHDRKFLDAVTEETIIFRNQKLTYHPGNYEDWEKNTEEQRRRKTRLKEVGFFFITFL
jgi:ATP-binding cassette subfamily F protein 3